VSRRFRDASTAFNMAWRDSPNWLCQILPFTPYCKMVKQPTVLIHVVFALSNFTRPMKHTLSRIFSYGEIALRQYHQLMPWDFELLDRFPNDPLWVAVAIDIRGIPSIQTPIVRSLE
jgi:hypothetical protein